MTSFQVKRPYLVLTRTDSNIFLCRTRIKYDLVRPSRIKDLWTRRPCIAIANGFLARSFSYRTVYFRPYHCKQPLPETSCWRLRILKFSIWGWACRQQHHWLQIAINTVFPKIKIITESIAESIADPLTLTQFTYPSFCSAALSRCLLFLNQFETFNIYFSFIKMLWLKTSLQKECLQIQRKCWP